jgi:hypothetical protein
VEKLMTTEGSFWRVHTFVKSYRVLERQAKWIFECK